MGRDGFARQLRSVPHGRGDSSPHDVRCAETCQTRLVRANEERSRRLVIDASLAHQCLQRFDEVLWDRHDPFLAALAAQEHLWSWAIQLEIAGIGAESLRNASAGERQEKQQRPIATTPRRLLIRRVDESGKFVPCDGASPRCAIF